MGRDAAQGSPAARRVFEHVDEALGEPLSRCCFEGPLELLTLTANTQPALVATCCALVAALRERSADVPAPSFALGHSLGEYSALVAAGCIDLKDAVRLCRLRGLAMQEAVAPGAGSMAAIMGLDAAAVAELCAEAARGEVVSPANYNGPGQIVIAGHAGAVERVRELVASRGGKAVLLKVSAPFHCALMRPAAERLRQALAGVTLQPLAFPVIANVDATPNLDPDRARELLVQQVDAPVQWVKSIERIAEAGVTHALEIGPGKVLAGLVKRIARSIRVLGVSDLAGIDSVKEFLAA
jgi:[acyl-carrier-protein] S-malonyltransferase